MLLVGGVLHGTPHQHRAGGQPRAMEAEDIGGEVSAVFGFLRAVFGANADLAAVLVEVGADPHRAVIRHEVGGLGHAGIGRHPAFKQLRLP